MSIYVKVKEETSRRLHLVREPSIRAWAILVGKKINDSVRGMFY